LTRADASFESEGTRCAAWVYRPDGDGPHPCIVLGHGFSSVRDQRLDAYAERFAAAGMAAVAFDYRHFGDSDGEPRQLVDIERQLADWQAALEFARDLEGVDRERVALWGSSFSGGHVVEAAARDGGVAAVVSQVPFTDGLSALRAGGARSALRLTVAGLRDELRARRGREPFYLPAVGPPGSVAGMTRPEAEPGFLGLTGPDSSWVNRYTARVGLKLTGYRPYRKLPDTGCPVLVCIAERDQTTPPGPAAKAAERAPNATLLRYPRGHFEVYVGDAFERAVADQTAFLERELSLRQREQPARPPAPPARAQ
jgi:dienelactone hydrolase